MKMNRLFVTGALLLGSLSALGVGTLANKDAREFSINEMKAEGREVLRADGQNTNTPVITKTSDDFAYNPSSENNNLADNVSKAVVQTKPGTKADHTDIRFVAAVRIGLSKSEDKIVVEDGGQYGFHIKFDRDPSNDLDTDVTNVYAETSKYYMSISEKVSDTEEKWYAANGFSKFSGTDAGSMSDWTSAALGAPNDATKYSAFITMEVRNVPNSYVSYIEAQPYFVGDGDTVKKFATHTKKADTSGHSLFFTTIERNGMKESHKMEYSTQNETANGVTRDIHSSEIFELNEGDVAYTTDSYGVEHINVANIKKAEKLTVTRPGQYKFYYKTNLNTEFEQSDTTWIDGRVKFIFDNNHYNWSNVCVHSFDEVDGNVLTATKWPGIKMTSIGNGLFEGYINYDATGITLNDSDGTNTNPGNKVDVSVAGENNLCYDPLNGKFESEMNYVEYTITVPKWIYDGSAEIYSYTWGRADGNRWYRCSRVDDTHIKFYAPDNLTECKVSRMQPGKAPSFEKKDGCWNASNLNCVIKDRVVTDSHL